MLSFSTILQFYILGNFFQSVLSNPGESPESLFHNTVRKWRSRRDFKVWNGFTDALLSMFGDAEAVNLRNKLEIVGALEEGILVIEKATVAMGEGVDIQRDTTLSQMYTTYGQILSQLSAEECHQLALDPHTLLIGAETVSAGDNPSTFLCIENAENALRNGITLDATNKIAEKLMKEITGTNDSVHQRKPKEFVAELFDSFADTFDEKLNDLEYKVPKLVGDVVGELKGKYDNVLDAGCGTGLAGRFVRPFITSGMVGVDASRKMLDVAAECTSNSGCGISSEMVTDGFRGQEPLYESLLQMDLEDMNIENTLHTISKSSRGFDLVIAADVLVYFGSLEKILSVFAKVSAPNATLVFSCERAKNEDAPLGWRLLASGRFAHTKDHIVTYASQVGYELSIYKEIVPRMERGEEVQGHLFGFILNHQVKDEL